MGDIVLWNTDSQKDFMLHGYAEGGKIVQGKLYVPNAEETIPNIKSIFESAAQNNLKIISTADEHDDNSKELAKNGGAWPDHCMAGTEGQKNVPEALLEEKNVGVVHWNKGYGAKELAALLSRQQVILTKDDNDVFHKELGNPYAKHALSKIGEGSEVYVTGVATDYCVKCAVEGLAKSLLGKGDGFSEGTQLFVVSDAVKEIDPKNVAPLKREWALLGVKFIATKELLDKIAQKYGVSDGLKATFKKKDGGSSGSTTQTKKLNCHGPF